MVDFKCPNCGVNISIDDTREFGFCSYCGTKLQLVQKVKVVHEGTVNIPGIKSENQVLTSAKKMIEIGEKGEAQKLLENLVASSPDCGEAWLGLAYIRRYNLGVDLSNYLSSNTTPSQITQQIIDNFTNSTEMCKARKLMGTEINPIFDKLVASLRKNAEEYIAKEQATSKNIINRLCQNINLLDGFFYDTESDGQDKGFFSYNGMMYYYASSKYYTISGVTNNKINLVFDSFEHFSLGRYNFKESYSIEIHYATNNTIYTSHGRMWKSDNTSYSKRYEHTQNSRKQRGRCKICGGEKTLFGNCRDKCMTKLL